MTYTCVTCGVTTTDPAGWLKAIVQPANHDALNPQTMFPWVVDGPAVEYFFDTEAHRTQWLERCQLPL